MSQIPILFVGDSPSLQTGLARIGRDLATAVATLPQFRLAYLGRMHGAVGEGIADSRLPFMQYTYAPTAEDQWGTRVLPEVWRNHAGTDRGVIFTIWDPSRVTWFGNPLPPEDQQYLGLHEFLTDGSFDRWGYFAVDAEGPLAGGGLAPILGAAIRGYDRVLAYSQFGKRVIQATLTQSEERDPISDASPTPDVDWAPHGINLNAFKPRDSKSARTKFGLPVDNDAPLIGCVMTNQPRKDWGLWARTMAIVAEELPDVVLWAHISAVDTHWDLRVLLDTFGLWDRTVVTNDTPSDAEMSWRYSACDLVVLPSLGEGFGYPIVEAQACGVPVVHGDYAGGAELIHDKSKLVQPVAMRLDTRYCMMRPVYEPDHWALHVLSALKAGCEQDAVIESVRHLDWTRLWPDVWKKWFLEGADRFWAWRGRS